MTKTRFRAPGYVLLGTLALATASCDTGGPLGFEGGRVSFVLSSTTEAPTTVQSLDSESTPTASPDWKDKGHNPHFQSANVTFSSVLARNLDGVLVDVTMDLPVTLDVVAMERGKSIALPDGDLPPATYDQVVVVMTQVEGVTRDGTTIAITPPGGGWTAIIPICPFDVAEDATTVVGLQLSVSRSFSWRNNRFHFQPRFVCEAAPDDGEGDPES